MLFSTEENKLLLVQSKTFHLTASGARTSASKLTRFFEIQIPIKFFMIGQKKA